MAKRGRKAKPTALKLISGNPGKRALNKNEPKPPKVYRPQPPSTFTKLEKAKWRSVVTKLSACKVLTELDLDALEIYVRNWVAMVAALNDITLRGKMLASPTGGPMWNPSWSHYKHAEGVVRSLQAEFGMTPSSRTGIVAVADSEGKNEWDEF